MTLRSKSVRTPAQRESDRQVVADYLRVSGSDWDIAEATRLVNEERKRAAERLGVASTLVVSEALIRSDISQVRATLASRNRETMAEVLDETIAGLRADIARTHEIDELALLAFEEGQERHASRRSGEVQDGKPSPLEQRSRLVEKRSRATGALLVMQRNIDLRMRLRADLIRVMCGATFLRDVEDENERIAAALESASEGGDAAVAKAMLDIEINSLGASTSAGALSPSAAAAEKSRLAAKAARIQALQIVLNGGQASGQPDGGMEITFEERVIDVTPAQEMEG